MYLPFGPDRSFISLLKQPARTDMRNILVLFALLLLFVTPVHLHAQDDQPSPEPAQNNALLSVHIDPYGAANVSLALRVEVQDQQSLKRALTETFSFPIEFRELPAEWLGGDDDEVDPESNEESASQPSTLISAK